MNLCVFVKVEFERNGIKRELQHYDIEIQNEGVINMENKIEKEVFDIFDDLFSTKM